MLISIWDHELSSINFSILPLKSPKLLVLLFLGWMLFEKTFERSGGAFLLEGSADTKLHIHFCFEDNWPLCVSYWHVPVIPLVQFTFFSHVFRFGSQWMFRSLRSTAFISPCTIQLAALIWLFSPPSLRFLNSVLNRLLLSPLLNVTGQFPPLLSQILAFQQHFWDTEGEKWG